MGQCEKETEGRFVRDELSLRTIPRLYKPAEVKAKYYVV